MRLGKFLPHKQFLSTLATDRTICTDVQNLSLINQLSVLTIIGPLEDRWEGFQKLLALQEALLVKLLL
jgi:hypothetical protein